MVELNEGGVNVYAGINSKGILLRSGAQKW